MFTAVDAFRFGAYVGLATGGYIEAVVPQKLFR